MKYIDEIEKCITSTMAIPHCTGCVIIDNRYNIDNALALFREFVEKIKEMRTLRQSLADEYTKSKKYRDAEIESIIYMQISRILNMEIPNE